SDVRSRAIWRNVQRQWLRHGVHRGPRSGGLGLKYGRLRWHPRVLPAGDSGCALSNTAQLSLAVRRYAGAVAALGIHLASDPLVVGTRGRSVRAAVVGLDRGGGGVPAG